MSATKLYLEERKDTLIVTNLETSEFKVMQNNGFNRLKYGKFQGIPLKFAFDSETSVSEIENMIFKVKFQGIEATTEETESGLLGEIIELATQGKTCEALEKLTVFVETFVSPIIQKDLIVYLLGSYSNRLEFLEESIVIDGKFKVYFNGETQEVISTDKSDFQRFCLVQAEQAFEPQFITINNKVYVLTDRNSKTLSKILFCLEGQKHKDDSVFWNQVKHLYGDCEE